MLLIFDEDENQAWISFTHEVIEFRLRPVLKVYRDLVNHLISIIEKIAYERKEEALNLLLSDMTVWKKFSDSLTPTELREEKHERNRN